MPLKNGDIFLNSGTSIKYKNLNYLNDSVEFYDQKSLKSKYSLDEIVMITERRDNIGRGFLGGCFVALLPILVKEINPNLEIFKLPLFPAGTYEEMKTKQRNTYIAVGCVTVVTFTLLGAIIGTKEIIYSKGSTSLKFQPGLGITKYSIVYAGITFQFTFK